MEVSLFPRRLCAHLAVYCALTTLSLAADVPPPAHPVFTWQTPTVVAVTLLLGLWVAGVLWARKRLLTRLRSYTIEKTRTIASTKLRRASVQRVLQLADMATRLTSLALILGGLFVWSTAVMEAFETTRPLARHVELAVWNRLAELLAKTATALPDLMVIAVIFFIARTVQELLNIYFRSISEGELSSRLFDDITAETSRRLCDLGIWIVAVIIAYPYLPGSETAAFRGFSVLAGLMLTLGSANMVSQFTNGLTLIYGRVLRPGDYVETPQGEGKVESIGLFSCKVRTIRDELLALPNSVVAGGLKNFSQAKTGVRFAVTVTIGYDAPWRQVRDLLLAAADATPGVRKDPAPNVRQAGLDDFYVRYEVLFTPDDPAERIPLLGRLHENVQDRFHEAGVQIMSPHYLGDPTSPKIPRR